MWWACCQEEESSTVPATKDNTDHIIPSPAVGGYADDEALNSDREALPIKVLPSLLEVPAKTPAASGGMTANVVVKLDKSSGDPIGVTLDKADRLNLILISVDKGLLKTQIAETGVAVKPGFRIAKVNGVSGFAEDLVEALIDSQGELEIEFEPFTERTLSIFKRGKKLGVALALGKQGLWVTVSKIEADGAVPDFNRTSTEEKRVKVHDKIISVDGRCESAEVMLGWMKERPSFNLSVYSWQSLTGQEWVDPEPGTS
eukprot:TRINITY_DN38828_c0_g1_i1.p1 TRINITY_DN38828_c0_g1~~TRINITY_DN38828_c0_g1_i1.p1  ORF type:complete len:258 (+),score=42.47 TRINITY_DN38828_c0_g1_i1:51-824(+)